MDWNNEHLERLESIDILKLNIKEVKFIKQMKKFASIGITPTEKQLQYMKWLSERDKIVSLGIRKAKQS